MYTIGAVDVADLIQCCYRLQDDTWTSSTQTDSAPLHSAIPAVGNHCITQQHSIVCARDSIYIHRMDYNGPATEVMLYVHSRIIYMII